MKIHFVDLKRQYDSIAAEIDEAIKGVIFSSAYIGGYHVRKLEEEFAKYVGVKHCIGVGNGTDALYIVLKVSGIRDGDEVIVPANSFIATSEAVTMTGATVKFVDCGDTYNINVALIEKNISKKTRAIVPVHLYGRPAEMDLILEIAKKYNLLVVEDAAQAHGAKFKGKSVGSFGKCACFSFYPGKNLGAYGDGGAIVTEDDELAEAIRKYANHGRIKKYDHESEGINSRLDGLQAAVLSVKLRHLDSWNKRRAAIALAYNEGLSERVIKPSFSQDLNHVYHLYVVRVKNRENVMSKLEEKGIETGVHYPIPLPFLRAYSYMKCGKGEFPVAWETKDEILSLPMHGDMQDDEVAYVIEQVNDIVNSL